MELLGIDPNSIGEDDNLAGMGIDSMQVVEVRARIQRALGRPIPLEEVRPQPDTLQFLQLKISLDTYPASSLPFSNFLCFSCESQLYGCESSP